MKNNEFSSLQRLESLTFKQALYQFPNTKIVILDEDGVIVAANPSWLDATNEHQLIPELGSQIGANFFEICRLRLAMEDSTDLINGMKKVIVGIKKAFLQGFAETDEDADQNTSGKLFICPLSDSPNSIAVAYRPSQASDTHARQPYQEPLETLEQNHRDFA